jgi:hypothetical protein
MQPMAGRLRNWGGELLRGRTASTSRAVVGLLLVLAWTIGLQVGTLSGGAQLLFVPVVFAALTLSAGQGFLFGRPAPAERWRSIRVPEAERSAREVAS